MPQLIARHARHRDDGVAALIVTFFFGAGVFVVLLALVVDIGLARIERRELQNGADAAAVQAAYDCSLNGSSGHTCGALQPTISIASLNSSHLGETVTASNLCGSGSTLSPCPAPTTILNCPPATTGAKYAQVTTSTWEGGISPYLPQFFSRTFMGPKTISACSRAAWGVPAAVTGLMTPFAISGTCWQAQVAGVSNYGPASWSSAIANQYETVTTSTYTSGSTSNQATSICGNSTPGGFGSLNTVSSNSCTVSAYLAAPYANWLAQQSGNAIPCPDVSTLVGKVVTVPIYDCAYKVASTVATATGTPFVAPSTFTGTCANLTVTAANGIYFRVVGLASYFLAGYDFGGNGASFYSTPGNPNPFSKTNEPAVCKGSQNCIFGWYTQQSLLSSSPIDNNAPDFGTYVVSLIG